jgi:hypothetical protein
LRKQQLTLRSAAVIDVDVVKEGGTVFSRLLDSALVPEITKQSLATARAQIHAAFKAIGKDPVIMGGVNLLSGGEREAAEDFFSRLAEYGIFVVERGALESWLPNLGASLHKDEWLPKVFEAMGEDPAQPGYVKPTSDDVWVFLDTVARWLRDPNKRGIPV